MPGAALDDRRVLRSDLIPAAVRSCEWDISHLNTLLQEPRGVVVRLVRFAVSCSAGNPGNCSSKLSLPSRTRWQF